MTEQNSNGQVAKRQPSPVDRLKMQLNADSVREQFNNALKENAGAFTASVIDLYASDIYLQKCNPNLVIMECLKAATLKLPINKQLGFAYVVPYKNKNGEHIPQFQLGYKGYIQLAMRTGQYRFLNAGIIYEGVTVVQNMLTGETEFNGESISQKVQGYFAYLEMLNGFTKTVYMTKEEMIAHAKRYSKSYNRSTSAWKTNLDEMAQKTVIRKLLSKFGYLSTEMVSALSNDEDDIDEEIKQEANQEVIDVEYDVQDTEEKQAPEPEQEPIPIPKEPEF
ncbi:MAG: recombinase RecT [Sphaerochaeta sp.]|nr:recombinase RecT [Sphaerochaeta sp.]